MSRQHQQERSEAVKQMILEAALEIELEDGEDKVTVRRIGEKIGYSTGVIYYHFRSRILLTSCPEKSTRRLMKQ